jgi:predicted Zn finger-like uncharacterized protein
MIEVQCTSCHTRYRIDEQVLPEGTPTFKCSRCGHVFSVDPRRPEDGIFEGAPRQAPQRVPRMRPEPEPSLREEEPANEEPAAKVSAPFFPSRDPSEASAEEESSPESESVESREASVPPEAAAPVGPSTEELVARSFEEGRRERREPKTGETPSFEFKEEKGPEQIESEETPRSAAATSLGSTIRRRRRPTSSSDHRLVHRRRRSFWTHRRCRKSTISCGRKRPRPSITKR